MATTIALAGNPNSGKTTLFNALTGSNQYVGNWPGVTVEKKEGKLKGNKEVLIQDLPGIYSLSPYTLEEVVSRDYLVNEKPNAILNIVDGTNIERNLYLSTQLMELGIPVVIALNMIDLVRKSGDKIDVEKLSKSLGCKVIEVSALKGEGAIEAINLAVEEAKKSAEVEIPKFFAEDIEKAIQDIETLIKGKVTDELLRWHAVKLFERDEKIAEKLSISSVSGKIEEIIKACEKAYDDDSESIIANARYNYITEITSNSVKKVKAKDNMKLSDRIDKVVTNRILGLPIFAVVMFLIYAIAMGGWSFSIGTKATEFTNDVIFGEWVPNGFDAILGALGLSEGTWIYSLIQDGIVAGVGAVLGFVPQMLVLFFLMAILEDIGYMSRVAFVMDRVFRQFGLSGKSFIPCMVSMGCGVPGVMAARTIEQNRDRKLTVMTATFMPCGAKLPIIGLIAGAVLGGSPWVASGAYFLGIGSIILSGLILKKFKSLAGDPAPFVMELPAYHITSIKNILITTWQRGWAFIKRAGSVILISTIIIWFLTSFGSVNGKFGMVDRLYEDENLVTAEYMEDLAAKRDIPVEEVNAMDDSALASLGSAVSPLFKPLGFGNWKATVATVTGLIAKEEVVGTFGVLYNYNDSDGELSETGEQIWGRVAKDYTPMGGLAFMIFNLLCAPCFAAIGAIKREMGSTKWTTAAVAWMTVWAYVLAFIGYNVVGLIVGEVAFGIGPVIGIALLVGIIYLLVRKGYVPKNDKNLTSVQAAETK